jgi:hypothetical protein
MRGIKSSRESKSKGRHEGRAEEGGERTRDNIIDDR